MRVKSLTFALCLAVLGITYWFTIPTSSAPSVTAVGPRQSSSIALTSDDRTLLNVNPEANTISVFDVSGTAIVKLDEIKVGHDPESVAVQPDGTLAYVANSFDGTVSVVNLKNLKVKDVVTVGAEPSAVAVSPNGTRLYVANSSSNNLMVFDATKKKPEFVATVDLSPFGTAPRAISITNDGDKDDTDETVFVALFYAQLRPGKTAFNETEDDQREGRVVAISAATNNLLSPTITLQPITDTGFNANGRLSPGPGQVPNVASTNPQTFTTPTGCYPNQLASIAIHPNRSLAYVVSTGASPNGPQRFNVMAQGMVSVYNTSTGAEVTAGQTDPNVRRKAPLNLNQGINLSTTPAPRLFLTNPVAMTWRPDGSDAWIVVQHADLIVRLTIDANGIPTVAAPLVAGPSQIVRVDLEDTTGISGKAPRGIVINSGGSRAYTSNFVSRSVTSVDISAPTAPSILATAQSTALPAPGTFAETAHFGEELFFTGRGPQGRMSQEAWGGCVVCHPKGRSDNVTWHFDAGPRQTIPLDGMISDCDFHDQRILNWSAVRDENQDFELNTRNVFGGRGLIDDDRLFLAIGGTSGATPTDSSLIEQFQQFTGAVSTTNDLAGGAGLPALAGARRDFAVATASDARVFIIGGRTGAGQGSLVTGANTVLEFNPRTNTLTPRSNAGFTPRHSLGAAAVKTSGGIRIYAVGGYSSTDSTAAPVGTVEEFNPATNTWRTVATLPTAVAQFGMTVAGGINTAEPRELIHIVSGNTGSEATPSVANPNPVQRFQADPIGAGAWTTFNPAGLTLRRNHGAATGIRVVSSRVFVIGGQDAGGNVLTTVEEYQAQAVTLVNTPHTSLPSARARFGIGFTLTSGQIYVIGGIDGTGLDQTTILEYSIGNNGPVVGPPGTPSGAWVTRGNISTARRGLQVTTPPGVTNFLPVQSGGRDPRQDAIVAYIAANVRSARAPVSASDPGAVAGRQLFQQVGLVVPGFSCETCHGGPKLTRSTVDYTPPPSADIGLGLGNEQVIGAELRRTNTQPNTPGPVGPPQFPGVLLNVGTFTLGGGRTNEIRSNLADIGAAAAPLGANGFNIPSLFSVHETAPYFYSGLAQTLEDVLNGSVDGNGGVRHHFVVDSQQRANLIRYLNSIEPTNDPQQILQSLINLIQALVDANILNHGEGNSLIVKLEAAIASINRGSTGAACNQLNAFLNEVDAMVKSGRLTPLQAQGLIQLATKAQNGLNCGGTNPIDCESFFVRQHYLDFLTREPEDNGLNAWLSVLDNCAEGDDVCMHEQRLLTSGSFFGSPEFQLKAYFAFRFYRAAFGRLPDYSEISADMQSVTGQTPTEVYSRKASFTNSFVQRAEFADLYNRRPNANYVASLMTRYGLNRITTPAPAQPDGVARVTFSQDQLVSALNAGTLTRAQVLRAIADSDQVFQSEYNGAFVAIQYYGYLRRTPETGGYNMWLNYLNAHPGDSREMLRGFVDSIEYRSRFGTP